MIPRPDGTRQIDWLVQIAENAGCDVMLSMRDDSPPPVDRPVVIDLHPGGGPLAALAAFHVRHPEEPVLVLGGDLFLLDARTVEHLLANRDSSRKATAYANRIDGRSEPLCAIYEVSGISRATEWIARGDFHARHFLESLDPRVLELPHPAALDGANTPHDLAECFAKLQHGVTAKSVGVSYFGQLREKRGLEREQVETLACTVAGLFEEVRFRHRLKIDIEGVEATLNGRLGGWDEPLSGGDEVVFVPVS